MRVENVDRFGLVLDAIFCDRAIKGDGLPSKTLLILDNFQLSRVRIGHAVRWVPDKPCRSLLLQKAVHSQGQDDCR
jgi:hypothetical protein